tara:strand:+ start:10595 stop:10843 length:249 start_codon:yes stop_codon:yes gene_type:complete
MAVEHAPAIVTGMEVFDLEAHRAERVIFDGEGVKATIARAARFVGYIGGQCVSHALITIEISNPYGDDNRHWEPLANRAASG